VRLHQEDKQKTQRPNRKSKDYLSFFPQCSAWSCPTTQEPRARTKDGCDVCKNALVDARASGIKLHIGGQPLHCLGSRSPTSSVIRCATKIEESSNSRPILIQKLYLRSVLDLSSNTGDRSAPYGGVYPLARICTRAQTCCAPRLSTRAFGSCRRSV
jgi:hypothetical protein